MEEQSISPMKYVRMFFRRKWFVIIPTFAGLVLGICSGMVMPKEYKSQTILLVEEGKTDNPLFNNIAVSSSVQQRVETIRESMLGWVSLVELVKRLGMDKDVKSTYEFEQLILRISNKIKIAMRGPHVIDLSYTDSDPLRTQAVVKTISEIFIERNVNVQNQETADAIKFIEQQLKVYRGKIKSAEIAQLKDQLDTLLVDSTEKHPQVKLLREQINHAMEELHKENLEYTEDVLLQTGQESPLLKQIQSALDKIDGSTTIKGSQEPDLTQIMLIDKLDKVMSRDAGVNSAIYNQLLQRLETAKITQRLQSSKEGTKYTVIEPPRVPLRPFKPNRGMVTLIGLIAGLGLGVGLVFVTEFLDKSFLDIEDASTYLGVPLLGAISKIVTVEAAQEEAQKERWIVFWMVSIGCIAVAATFMVSKILA